MHSSNEFSGTVSRLFNGWSQEKSNTVVHFNLHLRNIILTCEYRLGQFCGRSILYGMRSPTGCLTVVVPKLKYRNARRPGVTVRNRTKRSTTDLIQSKRWPKMTTIIYGDLLRGQSSRRRERIPVCEGDIRASLSVTAPIEQFPRL
jgi:hypothetical protein